MHKTRTHGRSKHGGFGVPEQNHRNSWGNGAPWGINPATGRTWHTPPNSWTKCRHNEVRGNATLQRLMFETDGPYMAVPPFRSKIIAHRGGTGYLGGEGPCPEIAARLSGHVHVSLRTSPTGSTRGSKMCCMPPGTARLWRSSGRGAPWSGCIGTITSRGSTGEGGARWERTH